MIALSKKDQTEQIFPGNNHLKTYPDSIDILKNVGKIAIPAIALIASERIPRASAEIGFLIVASIASAHTGWVLLGTVVTAALIRFGFFESEPQITRSSQESFTDDLADYNGHQSHVNGKRIGMDSKEHTFKTYSTHYSYDFPIEKTRSPSPVDDLDFADYNNQPDYNGHQSHVNGKRIGMDSKEHTFKTYSTHYSYDFSIEKTRSPSPVDDLDFADYNNQPDYNGHQSHVNGKRIGMDSKEHTFKTYSTHYSYDFPIEKTRSPSPVDNLDFADYNNQPDYNGHQSHVNGRRIY